MAAVVAVLGCGGAMQPVAAQVAVRPGVDVLLSDSLHLVRGKRVGCEVVPLPFYKRTKAL